MCGQRVKCHQGCAHIGSVKGCVCIVVPHIIHSLYAIHFLLQYLSCFYYTTTGSRGAKTHIQTRSKVYIVKFRILSPLQAQSGWQFQLNLYIYIWLLASRNRKPKAASAAQEHAEAILMVTNISRCLCTPPSPL